MLRFMVTSRLLAHTLFCPSENSVPVSQLDFIELDSFYRVEIESVRDVAFLLNGT